MNRTTNAESTGAFLLICDLPSATAAKSIAAFPKAASLRVSFVDPRKRSPRTVKSYHQYGWSCLLKRFTLGLHERSHGRCPRVSANVFPQMVLMVPHSAFLFHVIWSFTFTSPALQRRMRAT